MNRWLLLLVILFIVYLFYDDIITFLYSHFGSKQSNSEDDKRSKNFNGNWVDKSYGHILKQNNLRLNNNNKIPQKLEIPTIDIDDLTREKFVKLTNNFTFPIVVKGFLKKSRACNVWNLDYLSGNYGQIELPIIGDGSTKNQGNYLKRMSGDYQMMKLSDHIDSIKKGKKTYLNNVSRIFGLYPELLDDMELEQITKYTGVNVKDGDNVTHMFLGGKGTGSSLHCSITGNFFYNIKGQKRWILIHPKWSRYLMPNISATGLFVVSQLDLLNTKQMPSLSYYDFTLDEGDLFFNPPWWWHAVQNKTEYTIGCANRFSNFWVGLKNNPLYTSIFFSHPVANYQDFNFSSKREANLNFDRALLRDILGKSKSQAL